MTVTTIPKRDTALQTRSLTNLIDYRVVGADGEIGRVADLYFDDASWTLRYFVVETGGWFEKRRVLVSPSAFTDSDGTQRTIATTMTREQIEKAPNPDLAKPVSRQQEIRLHEFFAWPMYWVTAPAEERTRVGDAHLRSMNEVVGYRIQAEDGEVGHVEDLIAEERSWIIRYLAIDTRNWLPGRKVLVSPLWVDEVVWADNRVKVALTRNAIEKSPPYDPARPVNRAYEERLFDFYGRRKYWA